MTTPKKYTPKPGDIGLTRIGGLTGVLVGLGQFIIRDASRYTHVFVVLDDDTVLEAMPGGAIISPLSKYAGTTKYGSPVAAYLDIKLTAEQRTRIVEEARQLVGTPYSFLDYVALALERFGLSWKRLENYVASTKHMICSQLADEVYKRAGVHLFEDGRLSQKVTPGDLTYVGMDQRYEEELPGL
ncbi:peptidase [Streptomyces phage Wofford]|uniref:Peptidase n=1 Tax=Streptomyces phage Wofford TaxID=2283267 RepID=A0A345M9Z1_9CAUD|nr:enoyl-CoA hydratase/carnithine racemase-like [Streptomyces phage Wollford]AXH67312.1 peptidase [Streptomyces phage Wollford]